MKNTIHATGRNQITVPRREISVLLFLSPYKEIVKRFVVFFLIQFHINIVSSNEPVLGKLTSSSAYETIVPYTITPTTRNATCQPLIPRLSSVFSLAAVVLLSAIINTSYSK